MGENRPVLEISPGAAADTIGIDRIGSVEVNESSDPHDREA
jgi:hypothetical protein